MTGTDIVQVCIPNTSRDWFDYEPAGLLPVIGARVWVPFRKRTELGIVVGYGKQQANIQLKSISSIIDAAPLISPAMLTFCQWIADYYQSPLSEVLPLALPKKLRQGLDADLPVSHWYQLAMPADNAHAELNPRAFKQHALLDYINQHQPAAEKTLVAAGFGKKLLTTLLTQELICSRQELDLAAYCGSGEQAPLALNAEQQQAVTAISERLGSYHCFMLQGVTGSGKTEVYLHVIAQVLAAKKQVLVLVPEIGLTPQLRSRFHARFNVPIAILHSSLNETERAAAWKLAHDNQVKLVIGTRAALFTPLPELGLIVIDEEHDSSLKQMDGVRYSARDGALIRAHQANIPIILGSATPSLESIHNCQQKKYTLLRLNQKAISTTPLFYQVVDLRNTPIQHGLAPATIAVIDEHLKQNNQVLVFINRRGFAPVLLCHQCGWMVDCKACDSHLTLHTHNRSLMCHHCGSNQAIPTYCRRCRSRELIPVGAGTQRIHEYLQQIFPATAMMRVDRDEVRGKHELDTRLEMINQEKVQLIVGTQMLAKGHHFPRLTLVVVVEADAGFYNQDFRAIEQLGQLLTQVAGRAGRAEQAGQVLIQTHLPQHPLLNILIRQGYDAFAESLLANRQLAALPPYQYLAVIRAQDRKQDKILQLLHAMKQYLNTHTIQTLGPAPAPLARKANLYRMQLLLKAPSRKLLQSTLTALRQWLTINKHTNGVRWNIDVDPQDLS
ncbi:primosomal protein N' [Legionella dresdenensis]|uniref:Replication restart protein PriA n=1 Tax=Legionella dresdenensis TaxID=450200 RepID=A0ABV8CDG6_9GAMM